MNASDSPRILTTTVGSYPVPDWLAALPSEQALLDATRVVFNLQRQAGIDLPTDGELYRFDVNHPDTNGMIEFFVHKLGGIGKDVGRRETAAFRAKAEMRFRTRPAAVVTGPITEGSLNLPEDCARAASVAGGPFKFTLTSPYMLARTLLDEHYNNFEKLTLAIADALAAQVGDLSCACVQMDEANIPGNPTDAPLAATAINRVLDAARDGRAGRPETVSKLRRDELHESPIVRKTTEKSGTRITRPSEHKVLRQSRSDAPYLSASGELRSWTNVSAPGEIGFARCGCGVASRRLILPSRFRCRE